MFRRVIIFILIFILCSCSGTHYTIFKKNSVPKTVEMIEVCNQKGGILECESYMVCKGG